MSISEYSPECGDVGFVGYEPGGVISGAVSLFTTGRGEAATRAVHQFQVIDGARVVEALVRRGVVLRTWEARLNAVVTDAAAHVIVFRPPLLFSEQRELNNAAVALEGKRYGFGEIILQALDGVLKRRGWLREGRSIFTNLGALIPWTMICSRVGNHCLHKAGILPRKALAWAPDDTFDEAIRRGWRVVCVGENDAEFWGVKNREKSHVG